MEEKKPGGKKPGQKYKSLLVWDILQKHTDEDHALNVKTIMDMLKEYGIQAERHSISRDINELMALLNRGQEAPEDADDLPFFEYEIEYDASKHGYKISHRPYEFDELRLLAECVRASKFISQSQEKNLLSAIEGMCSEYQIEELQNEVYLVGRNKTTNKYVMGTMLTINQAIRENRQISFHYQKYTLKNKGQQVDRRNGLIYQLSPFKLIISDGNYYMLAWDDKKKPSKNMVTYRLDRIKDAKMTDQERLGVPEFAKLDMRAYTRQHFGMYSGTEKIVSIRFTNDLLDTAVDRFGTGADVFYGDDDGRHFIVTTSVAVSNQFYGWICGFRKKAKIVSPPAVVEDFRKFISDISDRYESE